MSYWIFTPKYFEPVCTFEHLKSTKHARQRNNFHQLKPIFDTQNGSWRLLMERWYQQGL